MQKETYIFILLFVLTSITLFLGESTLSGLSFIIVVLFVSFLKGGLIIDYFMELKHVSFGYRFAVIFWLFIIVSVIGIAYTLPIKI